MVQSPPHGLPGRKNFESPGREAGFRQGKCVFRKSIPGLGAWAIKLHFNHRMNS
jgi:hypothetical protein